MQDYTYYKRALMHVSKPYALLILDIFNQNINDIIQSSNHKRIRVATKSIRCVKALHHIATSSTIFQGFMCYDIDEAIFLHKQGFQDLLIAYPV